MAEHTPTTPPPAPVIAGVGTTAREAVSSALCDCSTITAIIDALVAAEVSAGHGLCGTSYGFLGKLMEERHEAIRENLMLLGISA